MSIKESNEIMKCSYMHWTIFYAPFIPFIVLICHILEVPIANAPTPHTSRSPTNDNDNDSSGGVADLSRLTDFVLSLRPLTAHSEAIANLHRLCQVLCSVAKLYVEAKAQAARGQGSSNGGDEVLASVGQEFDVYLSALGLAPPGVGDGAVDGGSGSGTGADEMSDVMIEGGVSQRTQLGNWFSGNQYMMGLLEEDLSLIDFKGWL